MHATGSLSGEMKGLAANMYKEDRAHCLPYGRAKCIHRSQRPEEKSQWTNTRHISVAVPTGTYWLIRGLFNAATSTTYSSVSYTASNEHTSFKGLKEMQKKRITAWLTAVLLSREWLRKRRKNFNSVGFPGQISKTITVCINVNWGSFVQPMLPWKSNKYYIFWVCVRSLS
jgi:hypothetical protein